MYVLWIPELVIKLMPLLFCPNTDAHTQDKITTSRIISARTNTFRLKKQKNQRHRAPRRDYRVAGRYPLLFIGEWAKKRELAFREIVEQLGELWQPLKEQFCWLYLAVLQLSGWKIRVVSAVFGSLFLPIIDARKKEGDVRKIEYITGIIFLIFSEQIFRNFFGVYWNFFLSGS